MSTQLRDRYLLRIAGLLFLAASMVLLIPTTQRTVHAAAMMDSSCPDADPNDSTDDTAALQACLDSQDTVVLDPGSPGYIISSQLHLHRDNQVIESSQSYTATIIAASNFADYQTMLTTDEPAPNYYTINLITFNGNQHSRDDMDTCAPGSGEGNLNLDGYGYTVENSEIELSKCGTGIAVNGSGFTIYNNYVAWNGSNSGPGSAPWSDGITVLNCSGSTISNNTIVDNTDIDLVIGGGPGCYVHDNYIWNGGQTAFAGLAIGNFPSNGAGDFTGATIANNTIVGSVADRMQFGLLVGPHPWDASIDTGNTGTVTGNDISGAVINLIIEGVDSGTVTGNNPHDPQGSAGFNGCSISLNYSAYHFGSTTIQDGYTSLLFDNGSCQLQ